MIARIALVLSLLGCTSELEWSIEDGDACEGAGTSYWALAAGDCSATDIEPFEHGTAEPAQPERLRPGEYCFWSLRIDTEGDHCRLLAQDHATRVLPRDRSAVVLHPYCVDAESRAPGYFDAMVTDVAGCNPRCDPERCICPGSCTDAECPSPLVVDLLDVRATHACAGARGASSMRCWGEPAAFGLDGLPTDVPREVALPEGAHGGLAQIAVGPAATCVRTLQGEVFCFGAAFASDPVQVRLADGTIAPLDASKVAVGDSFACAVTSHPIAAVGQYGQVVCWGDASERRLGSDSPSTLIAIPVEVSSFASTYVARDVIAGDAHACFLSETGGAVCWGRDAQRQVDPYAPPRDPILPEHTLSDLRVVSVWERIAARGNRTCLLDTNYDLYCLGEGLDDFRLATPFATRVIDFALGDDRVCVRAPDGAIACAGFDGAFAPAPIAPASPAMGLSLLCGIAPGDRTLQCASLGAETEVAGHGHTRAGATAVCP